LPELPEVEALAGFLRENAVGRCIEKVELHSLSALKTFDPPLDALVGQTITGCGRRGKFLLIETDGGMWLALHLSRSGWVKWRDLVTVGKAVGPKKGPLALRVRLDGGAGFEVTEMATEKRLAIHVTRDPQSVEGIAKLGPDPLDSSFDETAFAALLTGRRAQIKGVLVDQSVIAGVGNAYSDEALHIARLSPFRQADKLTREEVARLYAALRGVLAEAVEGLAGLPASGLKSEKKSGMRVHGRAGEACPECGDDVRTVSFATTSLQYCATCQTGGKPLADRRMSRLLK
jgi:formamidopyrimidine-DNA glycosylase